ncbi:tripartite tricarboxylate transporter permease [Thermococcus sp. SY098]|uniref:tripartite tricarboxylate transporter permease n=1 Tax=Thermococcus sp. SY098 TaxID=3111325 RepID=UPI002D796C5D|nr:tripartite tricarboxylate transporter permease [Thermococcus sp. SY098]WRS51686.1 tripartite tricarboxylate transporter permease [Thermococcus sp. SY098]
MDIGILLLQATFLTVLSVLMYIIIGMIPGTDETATIAPITLALLAAGFDPLLVLAWFMGTIVAFKAADAVPTALAAIPGGVMAVPQVPDALVARKYGYSEIILRKGITASVIGTVVAIAIALPLSFYLTPLGDLLKTQMGPLNWPGWVYIIVAGIIVLAVMSKAKILALLAIFPFAMLVQGIRAVYGKPVFISIFLAITIGPILYELLTLISPHNHHLKRDSYARIKLVKTGKITLNPLHHLDKLEVTLSSIFAGISSILSAFMSPVGLTILFGDLIKEAEKDELKGSLRAYAVRDAIKNATYIGGTLIPLIAIGVPTGPMSAGPAAPFFAKLDAFNGLSPRDVLLQRYSTPTIMLVIAYVTLLAALLTYVILVKYSKPLTRFVFKKIPAEALYSTFLAIVLVLSYMEAGIAGIFGSILVGLISATFARNGVSIGVLFMVLVAAPYLVALL